ncbi:MULTISPECIES: GNAT family N-acetyltransferase [Actinoalloteichus]|uniref:Ribosomal-protein-alanine N-acetyltransferase n=1 Tax=Actinoalloteichus caeruleus DSM 43889 TaxID=1120930 RepID=A0ABT1JR06_ACTCY|nr:GNAT family N-acetyltransferase [Actinoalloteichus caeruleus]MCP2334558.1 ribosomal-protein-alanine N-acetyltransferase [Actinoalloteichus caeruleus DSM 43889]
MTDVVRTDRLLLKPYVREDEESFVRLFQDEEVVRYVGDGLQTEAADRALFHRVLTDVYPTRRFDVWAVWLDGAHVGHAELKPCSRAEGHELIYALARAVWGRGLGRELVGGLLRQAFAVRRLPELHATVDVLNTRSLVVLAAAGFEAVRDFTEEGGGITRLLTVRRGRIPEQAPPEDAPLPAGP